MMPPDLNYAHLNGAPGEIRTPDHLVRSQVLYPAELRALVFEMTFFIKYKFMPVCLF